MGGVERCRRRARIADARAGSSGTGRRPTARRRSALDQAHRDVEPAALLAGVVDRDHVRVLDRRGEARLAPEALAEPRVRRERRRDHLQRALGGRARCAGAVDDAHPTRGRPPPRSGGRRTPRPRRGPSPDPGPVPVRVGSSLTPSRAACSGRAPAPSGSARRPRGSRRRSPRPRRRSSSVIPPDASSPTRADAESRASTAARRPARSMLSSSSRSAPASSAATPPPRGRGTRPRPAGSEPSRARAHRLGDPARQGGVVLLDQDRVVEAHAVVVPAPGGDGGLLEGAQARGGLAGVEDARARARRRPRRSGGPSSRPRRGGRGSSAPCARRRAAPGRSPAIIATSAGVRSRHSPSSASCVERPRPGLARRPRRRPRGRTPRRAPSARSAPGPRPRRAPRPRR